LKHFTSRRFWQCFDALPADIQELARRNYALLKQNPAHPSLQFKPICSGRFRSVRVGLLIGRLAYSFLRVFSGSGLEAMLSMTRLLANKALHTDAANSAAPVS
jgi:hypothetical protein